MGGQIDRAGCGIDGSRLHRRDLLLAERLADDVETTRERRVAEGPGPLPWPVRPDGGNERLLGVRKPRGSSLDRLMGLMQGICTPTGPRSSPPQPKKIFYFNLLLCFAWFQELGIWIRLAGKCASENREFRFQEQGIASGGTLLLNARARNRKAQPRAGILMTKRRAGRRPY